MNRPLYLTVTVCSVLLCQIINGQTANKNQTITHKPKIQVAILLDVSNSMDGLIDQAKGQLWNMVKVLGKVNCDGINPKIEIALYEYGRTGNDVKSGYIKSITAFTNDLDKLFNSLQRLTTDGGEEFCAHAISTSIDGLGWDISNDSYKVIFIAGNESFLQGDITYTEACKKAKEKGVIVNTIYCGSREQGIAQSWNLGADCGNGSFTNIDQYAEEEIIHTPYDSTMIVLNESLNLTYIYYGVNGADRLQSMRQMDTIPQYNVNNIDKIIGYVVVKSDKNLYNRSGWDLIDASEKDSSIIERVDMKTLPENMKNKTRKELKQIVEAKSAERGLIREKIAALTINRDVYIASEKAKLKINGPRTLQTEIEKIIRRQVNRLKMKVE